MIDLYYGIFDWDDNILHMPTLIKAYDTSLNKFVWLTTEQYANVRNTNHPYTFEENSFDLFYDYIPTNFTTDIERALVLKTYGPSFGMFVDLVKKGHIIAIVTARGHESETLKNGCIYLINKIFNENDKKIWHDNLRKFEKMFTIYSNLSDVELEEDYWNKCFFVGLGAKKDQIGKIIRKVEDQKKEAIIKFVERVSIPHLFEKTNISIGFSDDDRANLQKIHDLFIELNNIYPMINFRVYDTSDRGLKKIVI